MLRMPHSFRLPSLVRTALNAVPQTFAAHAARCTIGPSLPRLRLVDTAAAFGININGFQSLVSTARGIVNLTLWFKRTSDSALKKRVRRLRYR